MGEGESKGERGGRGSVGEGEREGECEGRSARRKVETAEATRASEARVLYCTVPKIWCEKRAARCGARLRNRRRRERVLTSPDAIAALRSSPSMPPLPVVVLPVLA